MDARLMSKIFPPAADLEPGTDRSAGKRLIYLAIGYSPVIVSFLCIYTLNSSQIFELAW